MGADDVLLPLHLQRRVKFSGSRMRRRQRLPQAFPFLGSCDVENKKKMIDCSRISLVREKYMIKPYSLYLIVVMETQYT